MVLEMELLGVFCKILSVCDLSTLCPASTECITIVCTCDSMAQLR